MASLYNACFCLHLVTEIELDHLLPTTVKLSVHHVGALMLKSKLCIKIRKNWV